MKTHICSFEILIKSIKIQIKFPCSLVASLKIGRDEIQTKNTYQLKRGEAIIEQILTVKASLVYDTLNKKYSEKKAILTIHVLSNSGKNVAGLMHINIAKILNEPGFEKDSEKYLERCPDKNAKVRFEIVGKVLEQTQLQEYNSANVSVYSSMIKGERQSSIQSANYRNSAVQNRSPRPFFASMQHIQHGHSHDGLTTRQDKVQSFTPRINIYESATYLETSRRENNDKTKTISQLRMQITQKDRKITRLEIEKTSFQKEADLLKIQMTNMKSKFQNKNNKENQLVFQNQRLNKKLSYLESVVDTLKAGKGEFKRMDSFSTKFSTQELAYRSQRLDELQVEHKNMKINKQETERTLRDTKRQSRQLFQKSEDLQNALNTLQKRLQLKESFYKDELRKYNQKQIELENLKIQLNNTNYTLKDQLQQSQRKLSLTIRQKDKVLADQKSKYSRKNDQIKIEIENLRFELQAAYSKLQKAIEQNEKYEVSLKQKDQIKSHLQEQLDKTTVRIQEKQRTLKKKYQDQLSSQIEQLKQAHMLREQELEESLNVRIVQLQNATKTMSDKSQHVKAFNEKVNDLHKMLRQKDQKIVELNQSQQTLSKRLELTKKNEEKLNSEFDQIRLNMSKYKLQCERLNREKIDIQSLNVDSKNHHNQLTSELKTIIQNLTEEVDLEKNTIRIFQDEKVEFIRQIRELTHKLNIQNTNILDLNQKTLKLSEQLNEKNNIFQSLSQQHEKLNIILSEQKQQNNKQIFRISQLEAKTSRMADQSTHLASVNQQIKWLQKTIKDKETELKTKYENESKLEVIVQKQQYQIQSFEEQIRSRSTEFQRERQALQSLRKEANSLKEEMKVLKKNDQLKAEQVNKLQLQKSKLIIQSKLANQKIQSISQDYKRQKQEWFQRFKQFFNSIYHEESLSIPTINETLELDAIIKEAYSKFHLFKQFQQRQSKSKADSVQTHIERIKTQTSQMIRDRQSELLTKYQTAQQDFNFYKESMSLKQMEADDEIQFLKKSLQTCVQELNGTVVERNTLSNNYHNSLVRVEELSAYLEQTHRELQRVSEERNGIFQQLEQERTDKTTQLRRLNEQSSTTISLKEGSFQTQISQLEKQIKEKKKSIDNLQAENRSLNKQIDQRIELVKSSEKKIEDLKIQNQVNTIQITNVLKRERQLCEKVRNLEQAIQLYQEKEHQISIFGNGRAKEVEEQRIQFQKEREYLLKRISNYETDLNNIENGYQERINRMNNQNMLLNERISRMGYSEGESKRKDEQISYLNKELVNKKSQLNTVENEYNQYKRNTETAARNMREQLQRNISSMESLEKRLGNMASQLKFIEDKCLFLQNQKKILIEQLKSREGEQSNQGLLNQISNLKEHINYISNKADMQINQLARCKMGLIAQIQELTAHFKQKARQTAQHYDREIRQLTAKMVSATHDADERIKRAYKQKFEDRSALEFEVQCLRQELSKYTKVRVERNPLSRDEYVMEVGDSKMRLFLSQQPLRNIQCWIPSLVNDVKQYQETIYTHQKQIKELQSQLQTTTRIVETHLQPMRSKSSRRSTFFPLSILHETFTGTDGSPFVQKLYQILTSVQIALRRVQDFASQLQSVTQDKMIILTKTREIYRAVLQNQQEYVRNQLLAILDYSKIESGSYYVRETKMN